MDAGCHWSEIAWERVNESIDRKVVLGDRMMMVMYRMAQNQAWPEEVHEAEQGGYILEGRIELGPCLPKQEIFARRGRRVSDPFADPSFLESTGRNDSDRFLQPTPAGTVSE